MEALGFARPGVRVATRDFRPVRLAAALRFA